MKEANKTQRALSLALEALLVHEYELRKVGQSFKVEPAIKALEEALAKQEQGSTTCDEPVAWIGDDGNLYHDYEKPHEEYGPEPTPLYTTPQQRKPLTDGQADNLIANLEPLLDAKNQSWANAEKMLIDILAAVPQGSDK
jgi:hypothetical protein